MSPKELLYVEDALGHEKILKAQCQEALNLSLIHIYATTTYITLPILPSRGISTLAKRLPLRAL